MRSQKINHVYANTLLIAKNIQLIKKTLSRYQVNILLCGLQFIPMPNSNIIKLKSDIQSYN